MKRTCLAALAAMTMAVAPGAMAAPGKITNCPRTITQPGLYELQDNLDSVGTCIIVRADAVTIDLNGFRIRGNGTGAAITDFGNTVVRGTAVRNGTVANFANAIEISTGSVDNVMALDNTNVGISVITGAVRNSHAQGNVNNHGISVSGRSLVTGNVSIGNRTGISASHASSIRGNSVSDNTVGGILTVGTGLLVADNAVFNNGSFGIFIDCPGLVLGNTVLLHSTDNVRLNGAGCKDEHNVTQ